MHPTRPHKCTASPALGSQHLPALPPHPSVLGRSFPLQDIAIPVQGKSLACSLYPALLPCTRVPPRCPPQDFAVQGQSLACSLYPTVLPCTRVPHAFLLPTNVLEDCTKPSSSNRCLVFELFGVPRRTSPWPSPSCWSWACRSPRQPSKTVAETTWATQLSSPAEAEAANNTAARGVEASSRCMPSQH